MTRSITSLRASILLAAIALGLALLGPAHAAEAYTPAKGIPSTEGTPLNQESSAGAVHTSTGGASILRTIVGLAIVIAVIWGLYWVLRQVKHGREGKAAGTGLGSVASLPLGSGRSVHLVRAGNDYVLVGSAEQGVVPIYRYTEQQAREAGLLDLAESEGAGRPGAGGGLVVSSPARTAAGRTPPIVEEPSRSKSLVDRLREWTVRR